MNDERTPRCENVQRLFAPFAYTSVDMMLLIVDNTKLIVDFFFSSHFVFCWDIFSSLRDFVFYS